MNASNGTKLPASLPDVVTLSSPGGNAAAAPRFTRAELLPGRAMMVWQLWAELPGLGEVALLHAPPLAEAGTVLQAGPPDRTGNNSFKVGGAFLLPFANRIRGAFSAADRALDTDIAGRRLRLFANGGGTRPGAEQYAIHGLILDRAVDSCERQATPRRDGVRAVLDAGDFGGHWVSGTRIDFELGLEPAAFELRLRATNTGSELLPMGMGWHPYFTLPSGAREQARIRIPARTRMAVNDYDEVLPTGELIAVAGTPHDFSGPQGGPLGGLYLDDCFVDLDKTPAGEAVVEVLDPQAGYGLRIVSDSPEISAVQTYAPPDKPFVVLEPQFNWADPFGPLWHEPLGRGMARLAPGEAVEYRVRLELFTPARA
ncbi:aldose 1-epimerase [Azohydromonas caseinilytica]|uniref:Aldose 1-epimerase n=1 Tax=Azohydromonas caseinilytica TaxID=2728836 RepID=A0A848FE47_9BURK|nr:aldose 1-epimerase [Azohydromonas caseinilytica]NML16171.1 aldose 1-epimerase [Azohydromonas caseinilytica]